jgi:glutamine synthetase
MKEKILELVSKNGIEYIHMEYIDYVGITRSRLITSDRLESAFETGVSFSKATLGFNSFDEYIPNSLHGVDDGDFKCLPDPTTFMIYPHRKNTARMLTNMVTIDGDPWISCPRTMLRNVVNVAESLLGGKIYLGFEQEAYLLSDKEGELVPADSSNCFSTDGLDIQEDFVLSFIESLIAARIEVIQVSSEYGPGQIEVNLNYSDAITACDHQITFMQLFKQVARSKGLVGTLIPKPFETGPGSGLHIHLSLFNEQGENLFLDEQDEIGLDLSKNAYYFIGGLLKHVDALMAISAPSINSYKRLQPGTFAPAHACYGLGNRSALIRITKENKSKRLEFRGADGTSNPYLVIAAMISAGIDGIKNKIDPGEPINKDAAALTEAEMDEYQVTWLPRSLGESLKSLSSNDVIKDGLGFPIWKEYLSLKESEWIKYSKYVSPWELKALSKVF